jgi:hypothetical protein
MNSLIYKNEPFQLCRNYECSPKGNELIMNNEDLRVKSGVYLLDNAYNHMKKIMKEQENIKDNDSKYNDENTNETNFLSVQTPYFNEGFAEPVNTGKLETKICYEREIQLEPDQIQQYQMYPYKFQKRMGPNNFLQPTYEQSTKQSNVSDLRFRQYPYQQYTQQQTPITPTQPIRQRDRTRLLTPNFDVNLSKPSTIPGEYQKSRYPNFLEEAPNYVQPSQMIQQARMGTLQNPPTTPMPSKWNPLSDDSAIYKSQIQDDILKTTQYDRTDDKKFLERKQQQGNWITPVATQLSNLQSSPTNLSDKSINPVSKTFNQNQKVLQNKIQQRLATAPSFNASKLDGSKPTSTLAQSTIEKFENANVNAPDGNIVSVDTRCNYQKAKIFRDRRNNPDLKYHSYMELPESTFVPPEQEDQCIKKFDEYSKDSDLLIKNRSLRRKAGMDNLNREMCLMDFYHTYSPQIPEYLPN